MTEQQDPIRFALFFVGRSGSSFLQGLIDAHPQGRCAGEILWPHYRQETTAPLEVYLEELLLAEPARATGFKCPHEHLHGARPPVPVLPYMRTFSFRVLRLVRHNKLDQYLSMRLAQLNGYWTSRQGAYTQHQVEIDPEHFLPVATAFLQADGRMAASASGFDCHVVSYEGLVGGQDWRGVCEFLGLGYEIVESPFKRQRELRQSEAILNYDGLKAACRGTFAEAFFED